VLCAQQPPHRACPHCAAPLLTPAARDALIAQLEELRARTLAEEEEERRREEDVLRLAEGTGWASEYSAASARRGAWWWEHREGKRGGRCGRRTSCAVD